MLAAIFNISVCIVIFWNEKYCRMIDTQKSTKFRIGNNFDSKKTNSCRLYPLNSEYHWGLYGFLSVTEPWKNTLMNNESWKKCQNWKENNKLKGILWQSGYVGYVPAAIRYQTDSAFKILVAYKQYCLEVGFHAVFINVYSNQHDHFGGNKYLNYLWIYCLIELWVIQIGWFIIIFGHMTSQT